ncbi:hypothetical protein PF005_g15662 [Phytophthora fragariae]|uniref:Uncharacterized protein n=1 Tax=Phytophthora fragariae TaxID=53985 RepID=A0A6A3XCE8_9STRA|nr:hypothetical protein PF003_g27805 [Phytophthora fragariae]KAE8936173.1 hypothetical protein PF009_g13895 [Phytophthora fragariae]KAE8998804.1 hypothetical protein PF011_g14896 [Phytophthora fragariae]KAE9098984.1 hypothetical protein PF010_g15356 [Phytophthora fragariae]KAE9099227.1 hypothetical protein PF007_g15950 [Phytophthora fragariae]
MVFVVHGRASGLFVPVLYILSTPCTGNTYCDIIHFDLQVTDQQVSSVEDMCDQSCGNKMID